MKMLLRRSCIPNRMTSCFEHICFSAYAFQVTQTHISRCDQIPKEGNQADLLMETILETVNVSQSKIIPWLLLMLVILCWADLNFVLDCINMTSFEFKHVCLIFAPPHLASIVYFYCIVLFSVLFEAEMNIPKEIRSSVPDPLLSTIDCILGLTQLCRLSSPAALQVTWSCCGEVGQYYIKSVENSKISKHALSPWIFYEPDLSKCTSFVTQFII